MKEYATNQMVYDQDTGEYKQISGPVVKAETWEAAEKIAIDSGCVVVSENGKGGDDE